jgi:hypothetical protein
MTKRKEKAGVLSRIVSFGKGKVGGDESGLKEEEEEEAYE